MACRYEALPSSPQPRGPDAIHHVASLVCDDEIESLHRVAQASVHSLVNPGSLRMYKAAGWALVSLSVDPELAEAVVAKGGLAGLMAYIQNSDVQGREEAAWALANLSAVNVNAVPMGNAGVGRVLVEILSTNTDLKVTMQAMWALANLAVDETGKVILGDANAVPILVMHLQRCLAQTARGADPEQGLPINNIISQASRTLANLAVEPSNRPRIAAAGGLSVILQAAEFPDNFVQEVSAKALSHLSCDSCHAKDLLEIDANNKVLTQLLRSDSTCVQHEAVLWALNLSSRHGHALIKPIVVESLVRIIACQAVDAGQEHSARVLCNLLRLSDHSRMDMVRFGTMTRLSRVDLSSASAELKMMCTEIMSALGSVLTPSSRRALLQSSLMPSGVQVGGTRIKKSQQHRKPSPLSSSVAQIPSFQA